MNHSFRSKKIRTRIMKSAILIASGCSLMGFLDTCNDRLVTFTQFIDPCGTFLANCTPGFFQVNAADIGDFCVDPSCTIPGGCGNLNQPLGTITDICP